MKVNQKIWTVVVSTYCVSDGESNGMPLYANSDVYTDEEEAKKRFEEAKSWLVGWAGEPEREDGSFPGQKFVVKTSEDYVDQWERTCFRAERVTDKDEERMRGTVQLACEEKELFGWPSGKEFVRNIVNDILEKDNLDDNSVTDILLDDYGNCIHVTFTGGVSASTLMAIGQAFGEDDPNVYGVGDDAIKLVMVNNKYDELKD